MIFVGLARSFTVLIPRRINSAYGWRMERASMPRLSTEPTGGVILPCRYGRTNGGSDPHSELPLCKPEAEGNRRTVDGDARRFRRHFVSGPMRRSGFPSWHQNCVRQYTSLQAVRLTASECRRQRRRNRWCKSGRSATGSGEARGPICNPARHHFANKDLFTNEEFSYAKSRKSITS